MLSVFFLLMLTCASVMGNAKMTEVELRRDLSKPGQERGSNSNTTEVSDKIVNGTNNLQKGNGDLNSKKKQPLIWEILTNNSSKASETNLEKRKLATEWMASGQNIEEHKEIGTNVLNNLVDSPWRRKIPLQRAQDFMTKPKAGIGLRKKSQGLVAGSRVEGGDEDMVGEVMQGHNHDGQGHGPDVMPGPGKEILDTLNAWHEHRWRRLLDEYKIRGEGTSGIAEGWKDTIIRNWPTEGKSEKEKVEEMKAKMKAKMEEMEDEAKLRTKADGFAVPGLGEIWLENEVESEEGKDREVEINLPGLGKAHIPRKGSQKVEKVKRRRRVFKRRNNPFRETSSESKETSPPIVYEYQPKGDESEFIMDDQPERRTTSSLAQRGLHLLKTALQRGAIRGTISDWHNPPRTSLLARGLTILRSALRRPPPPPPTVVERFPIPPRVRRPPILISDRPLRRPSSTLVGLAKLAWEKLTPRLTIR